MKKITETGPVGLRGIRNKDLYDKLTSLSSAGDEDASGLLSVLYSKKSRPGSAGDNTSAYFEPQAYAEKNAYATIGDSQYDDKPYVLGNDPSDVEEIRYENQSGIDVLANGLGKMLGTAGTTFVSSLVGLPYGLFQAAKQGRASALWDNDVTQGLADVDKWLEKNMTNYQSQAQKEDPTYRLGDMNWWADNFIKNIGFTIGAGASMAVGAGSMGLMSKAFGLVNKVGNNTRTVSNVLSSLFSATGEGMIEARQGVEERNKLEFQKLNDEFAPQYDALEEMKKSIEQQYAITGDYESYSNQMRNILAQKNQLDERLSAGRQQILESGQDLGNSILLANQGLLTAGNLIQFSKGMTKSFDRALHAAETSTKYKKPFGVSASRVSNNLKDGYKIKGKNLGRVAVGTKGIITEGSEEMNQQWIQSSSEAAYNERDINDYWRAKKDPESYRATTQGLYTLGNILSEGFKKSWGDFDQWEQFLIGGMTGAMGIYMPTKLFNQDKTKSRFNPNRYGEWSGGVIKELNDFNTKYNQYEENIDDLNKVLQSDGFYDRINSMVGHSYTQTQKEEAVENKDKKAFKDADDKQFIHDVQAFLRAGKLDDLRAIYNEMGKDYSDDDIDKVIEKNYKHITAEEDKKNSDAKYDEEILKLDTKISELNETMSNINPEDTEELEKQKKLLDSALSKRDKMLLDKESYQGTEHYENSSFTDAEGNFYESKDAIKQELKHNAEELNRKLDSYLDSINYVNQVSGGNLTKDQEDNLVYLHNLGKESLERSTKIFANSRKQLPDKFLFKTKKTPEQLAKEYASSDLVFSKNDDTKEGYVEVDTSLLSDNAFRSFMVRDIFWGGNINPEFGETADEKAAREEDEKREANLSEEARKESARKRTIKNIEKFKKLLEENDKEAAEQNEVNTALIKDYFLKNYNKERNATQAEAMEALANFLQDLEDGISLTAQAGQYEKTFQDYLENPSLIDKDKEKEEKKAEKAENTEQVKKMFGGKSVQDINQGVFNGDISFNFAEDMANMDVSDADYNDLKDEIEANKKAKEVRDKGTALKNHVQEVLGDTPIPEELEQAIDNTVLSAASAEDITPDMIEANYIPTDVEPVDGNEEVLPISAEWIQDILAQAFNNYQADENEKENIPDVPDNPDLDGTDYSEIKETGHDATPVSEAKTAEPKPETKAEEVIDKTPIAHEAAQKISKSIQDTLKKPVENGTWRVNTKRYLNGSFWGTYHDTIADKNSIQYKRSKAIWEYLNKEHAYDRLEDYSENRVKEGKTTIHFMVKFFPEIYDNRDYNDLTEEEKTYATVLIMRDEKGVLGDLPLVQLERPSQQRNLLESLQNKVFKAFEESYEKGGNEAIVDGELKVDGIRNLNLTFENAKKSPLVSRVKQVMMGVIPYIEEFNTLNDVFGKVPFQLAVRTSKGVVGSNVPIITNNVGNLGQPYILLPTPTGKSVAIPFYTVAFNPEKHANTTFYRVLYSSIYNILNSENMSSEDKSRIYRKNFSAIKGLLKVEKQDNKDKLFTRTKDTITMNLRDIIDPEKTYDITVPYTDNISQLADSIVKALNGITLNVSLEYINGNIELGTNESYDYNRIIGEIADVNMPKNTTHTVNGWFTIELSPNTGIRASKYITPKTFGTISTVIDGIEVEINMDGEGGNPIAINKATQTAITDNENINLVLAQIKAEKAKKTTGNIQINIGGITRTYSIDQKKFIKEDKEAPVKPTTSIVAPAQPQSSEVGIPLEKDVKLALEYINKNKTGKIADIAKAVLDGRDKLEEGEEHALIKELQEKHGIKFSGEDYLLPSSSPSEAAETKSMTIEEIEDIVKEDEIVDEQNQDAWNSIPNELKLKMFNEGSPITISYNGKSKTITISNMNDFIESLNDANMAAKKGNLKASEAPKPMLATTEAIGRENAIEAKQWLAKNLPMLDSDERIHFVEKLLRNGDNAPKMWGNYRNGVIEIQNNAPTGTVYHEAFHYVMDMILTSEERKQILDAARERYGNTLNDFEAEEKLAEGFRKYVLDNDDPSIIGKIKRWFKKLLDRMNRYNSISEATINQLFWKINNGEFADKSVAIENLKSNRQTIAREVRNVQKKKYKWKNLDNEVRTNLKKSGLTEESYQKMSLEEKEQYVKCRG